MTLPTLPAEMILARRREIPPGRSLLVGVTGIDGSGKGYVTERLAALLQVQAMRVAVVNVDGWLNLPSRRFDPAHPAEHFYEHGLRLDALFQQLVLPLKEARSVRLVAELADATDAERYSPHEYAFETIDVILLEGIFLLKREHRGHFDLSFWIDCTFATALERVLRRGQEGLTPAETIRAYETIYFPAQRIHLERDDPRGFVTQVLVNDPRLAEQSTPAARLSCQR